MRLNCQFIELEHVLRDGVDATFSGDDRAHSAFAGRYRYAALGGPQAVDPDMSCLRSQNPFSDWARDNWARLARDRNVLPCGEIRLANTLLLGVSGLCIDVETGLALVGAPVNWGLDHAHWYISVLAAEFPGLTLHDGHRFEIDLPEPAAAVEPPLILLSSPGWNIYGHWILDYVPRLHLLRQMRDQAECPILLPQLPGWAEIFLEAFGVDPGRIIRIGEAERGLYADLRMPSAVKNGFSVAQHAARTAWRYFAEYVRERAERAAPAELPSGEKLFLSRRSFGSARRIENISELEALARDRGFVVVEPEKYTIVEQAAILRRARVVAGEDGSALHNVIFCDPGAHLGVIGVPDRPNLWHVSLCQSMGHAISYIEAAKAPGDTRLVALDEFAGFLDGLIA